VTTWALADARLANTDLGPVIELFVRRTDAERALRDVLRDEPGVGAVPRGA
jgi:hypothetical protein